MQRINLIPKVRQRARQRRVRVRRWVGAVLSYTALVAVVCVGYRAVATPKDLSAMQNDLSDVNDALAKVAQQRTDIQPKLKERQLVLAAGRSITDQPDWSRMLKYLADEVLGEKVVLTHCKLAPMEDPKQAQQVNDTALTFVLSGYAKDTPEVSRFVLRLEKMGLFDKVTLVRTGSQPFMTGMAIAFEVHCELLPGGGGQP